MALAYIFIKTNPEMGIVTYRRLKGISEIIEIHPLFGEFDIIVKVETEDYASLSIFTLEKIRKVQGVIETRTIPTCDI